MNHLALFNTGQRTYTAFICSLLYIVLSEPADADDQWEKIVQSTVKKDNFVDENSKQYADG
jgi:hypothetical protein